MSLFTGNQASKKSPTVIDVGEDNFEQEVINRSREVPIVVDFWAPWCGPCRTLGPILEKLASEFKGAFILAKVNVDDNQRLAQMFRVQGIPAVKAVVNGKIAAEFTGAQPESAVRQWLARFVKPLDSGEEVDELAALEALAEQAPTEAAARYRVLLAEEPGNVELQFNLARILLLLGDNEALALLKGIAAGDPLYARAQAALPLSEFLARPAAAPGSSETEQRYGLAANYLRKRKFQQACDELLTVVMRDRSLDNDGARRALLGIFALLGDKDPLVAPYRRKLANLLF